MDQSSGNRLIWSDSSATPVAKRPVPKCEVILLGRLEQAPTDIISPAREIWPGIESLPGRLLVPGYDVKSRPNGVPWFKRSRHDDFDRKLNPRHG